MMKTADNRVTYISEDTQQGVLVGVNIKHSVSIYIILCSISLLSHDNDRI